MFYHFIIGERITWPICDKFWKKMPLICLMYFTCDDLYDFMNMDKW